MTQPPEKASQIMPDELFLECRFTEDGDINRVTFGNTRYVRADLSPQPTGKPCEGALDKLQQLWAYCGIPNEDKFQLYKDLKAALTADKPAASCDGDGLPEYSMKERSPGFLANEKISHDSEVFDYIKELHEILWRACRAFYPGVGGTLDNHIPRMLYKADLSTARIRELETALEKAKNYVDHAYELIGDYTGDDRNVINAYNLIGNASATLRSAEKV